MASNQIFPYLVAKTLEELNFLSSFAQVERRLILERIRAGLSANRVEESSEEENPFSPMILR